MERILSSYIYLLHQFIYTAIGKEDILHREGKYIFVCRVGLGVLGWYSIVFLLLPRNKIVSNGCFVYLCGEFIIKNGNEMKKLLMAALMGGASLFALSSCETKSRVDELRDFVEKVQEEGSSYTQEQWKEANEEFSKLLEKLDPLEDMTPEEVQEVARLQGEYAAKAFKEQAGEAMEKAGAALGGFIQGLTGSDAEHDAD